MANDPSDQPEETNPHPHTVEPCESNKIAKVINSPAKVNLSKFHKIYNPALAQIEATMGSLMKSQLNFIQRDLSAITRIANSAASGALGSVHTVMQQTLIQEAARTNQLANIMRPAWNHALIGSALAESLRSSHFFQAPIRSELLRIQSIAQEPYRSIQAIANTLRDAFHSLPSISDFWRDLPAKVKENLLSLAASGWYIDPEMDFADIVGFKQQLENSTSEEVDSAMIEYFQQELSRIEETLRSLHSNRASLIKEAFDAHHQGKYSLSITAIFAQCDGICYDLTGYQLFSNGGLSRFAKRIDPETLARAYLEPLIRAIPISDTSKQRRDKLPRLNRHAVMHGESTDYPSLENSLRAISFINFVSHVLNMAKEQIESLDNETVRLGTPCA